VQSVVITMTVYLSVCLSVFLLVYLKHHMSKFRFFVNVSVAVARSSSDDSAIHCVIPFFLPRKRGSMFLPVLVCVCVYVSVCDHDN